MEEELAALRHKVTLLETDLEDANSRVDYFKSLNDNLMSAME